MSGTKLSPLEDGATINSQLQKLANEIPEKPAFIFLDKNMKRTVITRQEVWDKSRRFAAVLRRRGIVKGDIVCNCLVNSPERLITCYGTLLAGAVSMHGQTFLADGEDIIQNWRDSKCKTVILDPQQKSGAAVILDRIKDEDKTTGDVSYQGLPYMTDIITITFGNIGEAGSWPQALDSKPETYVDDSVTQDDVAFIFNTSGSTGFPKLVPYSQRISLAKGTTLTSMLDVRPESVYFNIRSLGWAGGAPVAYPATGITRVALDSSSGQPEDIGALIVQMLNFENCDISCMAPAEIQLILNALDAGTNITKPLRTCGTGGGSLSGAIIKSIIGRLTELVVTLYGATEMSYTFGMKVKDGASYENACVGYPVQSVEFKILGDGMKEVAPGERGEIYVRGPTNAKEYINQPEKTKETFLEDGWYRTSDVGIVNEKGQLFVYCRMSNAINHKGFLHYPGWMEARINKHPGIQESICVGIPDPDNHEEICLCLIKSHQANLSVDEVREFCKTIFLSSDDLNNPIPKHYLFFESFPLNVNAKIDRAVLKREVMKRLGL